MYRVLVVEDEALIRQGLIQSIHWDSLGLILAAEAENGAQALEILDQMAIDIVLTDMRMPVCDGRTMLQEMERRGLNCEIIVLSEYTDFAYMHQAIHAHVFDYLLKPVDPANLNALLQKAAYKLDEKTTDLSEDSLSLLFHSLSDPTNAHFLALCHKYEQTFTGKSLLVCCIQTREETPKASSLFSALKHQLQNAPYESRIFSYGESRKHFCILSLLPVSGETAYMVWLQKISQLLNVITPIRMGCSRIKSSLRELPEAMAEAKTTLQFIRRSKPFLRYQQVQNKIHSSLPSPINEGQLTNLLFRGREVSQELYRTVLNALDQQEVLYLPAARHMLSVFTLSLERCCQKTGRNTNISALMGGSYLDKINQLEWYSDLCVFLQDMLDRTFSSLESQDSSCTESVLRQVLQTVQTQYMEDLSLISFSQKYHINYIYLSRRFKEYTGETFTNYLMQIRMNKARQFIEQDGFSEKDTAPLVGYSNPYYFISSYQKYFRQEDKKNEK